VTLAHAPTRLPASAPAAAAGHHHAQADVSAALDRALAAGHVWWRRWPRPQLVAAPHPAPAPAPAPADGQTALDLP